MIMNKTDKEISDYDKGKPTFPKDYADSQGQVPRAERRGERCQSFLWCSILFGGAGIFVGAVAMWLYKVVN